MPKSATREEASAQNVDAGSSGRRHQTPAGTERCGACAAGPREVEHLKWMRLKVAICRRREVALAATGRGTKPPFSETPAGP